MDLLLGSVSRAPITVILRIGRAEIMPDINDSQKMDETVDEEAPQLSLRVWGIMYGFPQKGMSPTCGQ